MVGCLYPTNYDEEMSNVGAYSWQGAMMEDFESWYSNIVWILVESLEGEKKSIGISWSTIGTNE